MDNTALSLLAAKRAAKHLKKVMKSVLRLKNKLEKRLKKYRKLEGSDRVALSSRVNSDVALLLQKLAVRCHSDGASVQNELAK